MTKPYQPRGDSLAAHVIAFFKANPVEELSADDVVRKYGAIRSAVPTQLAAAVEARMLARVRSDDGEWVYKCGDELPLSAETSMPAAQPTLGALPWKPHVPPAPDVEPESVPLEENIPVHKPRGRVKQDWSVLLKRMKPGNSAVLPKKKRAVITRAVTLAHKLDQGRFAMAALPEDKTRFRLWREA